MKEGWKYEKLGDITTSINGLWKGKKEPFVKVGVIRNANFNKDITLNFSNIEYLDVEERQYKVRKLQDGDLIVEKSGGSEKQPVGRTVLFRGEGDFSVSNFTSILRINDKCVILPEFLYKYLLFVYYSGATRSMQKATTGIHNILYDKFLEIRIPIPPLPEQERIVSLLDADFAKIDAIKANAEKQLKEAKALFQSVLSKLFNNENWTYSTIGEIFKTYSGGTPHKSNNEYYENGNIPWINSGEVCQKYIETTNNFITEKGLKNSSAKYYPVNTVLVAMYGATAAQSGILKFEATSNQAVCGLLPNKNYVPEFVYYWFVYNKEKVASMAQGGAQPNLSQVKIKTISIPLISFDDQQQIAEQLDKLSAKIQSLQSNYETTVNYCNDLKQSILKDIFS